MNSLSAFFARLPWHWYAIAFVVIVLDQWTKFAISSSFSYNERLEIAPFFNLTLRHNYGVAFSLFDNIGGGQRWPLSALALIVSTVLLVWIFRKGKQFSFETLGLALVLGGAIGNLYDRVSLGYVVDFVEWHYGGYYWPAFNIADSAISIGAVCLLIDLVFFSKPRSE